MKKNHILDIMKQNKEDLVVLVKARDETEGGRRDYLRSDHLIRHQNSFCVSTSIFPAPQVLPCPYGLLCLHCRAESSSYPWLWAWLLMCFIQGNVSRYYASRGWKCAGKLALVSWALAFHREEKHASGSCWFKENKGTWSSPGTHPQWSQAWQSPA